MALRAALDVQRSLHGKKTSLVIERLYLRSIDESSRAPVGNDGAIVPSIPQPAHDFDELGGDLVAQVVLVVALPAEVERSRAVCAGNDVPGCPSAAEMVQRSERARDVKGLTEAC